MSSFTTPSCADISAFRQLREKLGATMRPPPGLEDVVPQCCVGVQCSASFSDDTASCDSTSTAADSQVAPRPVLTLSAALELPPAPPPPAPSVCRHGLPSVGSADHHLGLCKPCDFLHRSGDGCTAGDSCKFCHLCGPDENKLRKATKKRFLQDVKQRQQAAASMVAPPGL